MRSAKLGKHKRIFAWTAVATSLAIMLSVGTTHGRVIDWASAELFFTPPEVTGYSSDCLTANGQEILLADWNADEVQRTVEIQIQRPEPTEKEPLETQPDSQEPTQTQPETTEEPAEPTDPTQITEETEPAATEEAPEPAQEAPDPSQETTAADPTEQTWPQDEVTVVPDAAALQHLRCLATVEEHRIVLTLERLPEAPGLAQTAQLTLAVQWQNLRGTIVLHMLPYGDMEPLTEEEETVPERQIDTTLEPVRMFDTLAPENPVMCVKLNLQTCSDFTVKVSLSGSPLRKVRWSTDGVNYALLYDASQLSFAYPYEQGFDGTVFLDFSQALESSQRPTVAVEATGFSRQECTPVYQAIPQLLQPMVKAANLPGILEMNTRWGAATLTVQTIERLTADEEGNLIYTPDESMLATVVQTGIQMEWAQPELLPQPGSYRVQIQWIWNDICMEEQIIYFFVNTN